MCVPPPPARLPEARGAASAEMRGEKVDAQVEDRRHGGVRDAGASA
jgi:hypothetical protein